MRLFLLLLILCGVSGCSQVEPSSEGAASSSVIPTREDDSTSCAYWKCSTEKKVYMQKYVKVNSGTYRPAGAYKLEGTGAFSLADLDKYKSDGENVNVIIGWDPCPHCANTTIGLCGCGKTMCLNETTLKATCPWCNRECQFSPGGSGWGVGGGG